MKPFLLSMNLKKGVGQTFSRARIYIICMVGERRGFPGRCEWEGKFRKRYV